MNLLKEVIKVEQISHNIGGIAMLYIEPCTGMVHGAGSASAGIE